MLRPLSRITCFPLELTKVVYCIDNGLFNGQCNKTTLDNSNTKLGILINGFNTQDTKTNMDLTLKY